MKLELLYPEICNLYGDLMNAKYLARCCGEIELVETHLGQTPEFVGGGVSLVYMGSTTERGQELALGVLRPHLDALCRRIDEGQAFLITGNACELLGEYIENEDGSRIEGLSLFPTHARREMMNRYNALYLGRFEDMDIVGYKSQFGHSYGDNGDGLFKTVRGAGLNPDASAEGFRRGNLMATYVLGPLLILNPPLAKYFLRLMGAQSDALLFEKEAFAAYELRLGEFKNPATGFIY